MEWFPPAQEVDPEGTIASMNTEDSQFVHGAENIVDYGEERCEQDREKRTHNIKPEKIHVGNIVDVAFSVIAVPMKHELHAFLVLRVVTLLDGSHTQNWIKAKICGKMLTKTGVQLKKRSAFDNEDEMNVEEARKKLRQMAVSDKAKMDIAQ
ncbi:hypothetical protein GYMLUDRAFT_62614 [Collybiopsis luxurians FD-317 M1]|uniref:Uncharacterized protein n=1 Tax=Collybiopsis luxurians FD-317 M1 TaxID=944289 RepID=A0A0D0BZH1_9AGAR|nr:hypothetical protein GYMLUDRAFT_62614 [Collybiopsis luxurians FD-317 M1]